MANSINESFTIYNSEHISDLNFYLNDKDEIFVSEPDHEWFSLINRKDWEALKEFIDSQFKILDNG